MLTVDGGNIEAALRQSLVSVDARTAPAGQGSTGHVSLCCGLRVLVILLLGAVFRPRGRRRRQLGSYQWGSRMEDKAVHVYAGSTLVNGP